MEWQQWIPVLVALVMSSPGMVMYLRDWRKSHSERAKADADAAKSLTDAAASVVTMLREELADLKKRVNMLEQIVQLLEEQLESLGHVPVTKESGVDKPGRA